MTREQAIAEIRRVPRRCRGARSEAATKVVKAKFEDGQPSAARRADAAGRKRCGYDFNEIIIADPFDGQKRLYKCPKCGVTGVYRSPKFDIQEPAA